MYEYSGAPGIVLLKVVKVTEMVTDKGDIELE